MLKIIMDRSSVTNIPDQATINNYYALYGDNDSKDLGAENDGDDHDSILELVSVIIMTSS